MTTITPELRQAIEQAAGAPVQITDPETQAAYIIVKAEVYERIRARAKTLTSGISTR